jgi:hypothetical protein
MATVGAGTEPWVVGDAIAHQNFEIHWEDSVDVSDGVAHAGHWDHIVILDTDERPVDDGWVEAKAAADGGTVELTYRIKHPGLREGLYTAVVYVDSDNKEPSARMEHIVPVTHSGEGVAKAGQEFLLTLGEPFIIEDLANPSAIEPIADQPFTSVDNEGPDPSPGAHQTRCKIAGSGGSWEDEGPPVGVVTPGTGQLAQFPWLGLPAGVYRADMWVDLLTTMEPLNATLDFTVKEAEGT